MTVQPDNPRKRLINALIVGLKADGVWSKLDWLCLWAAHDQQAARVNWAQPAKSATLNFVPTWTLDRGYRNGTNNNAIGLTIEAPNAAGNNATLNSVHISSYLNAYATVAFGGVIISSPNTANLDMGERNSGPNFIWGGEVSDTTAGAALSTTTNPPPWTGMWTFSRTGASARAYYKDGALANSDTQAQAGSFGTIQVLNGITGGLQAPNATTQVALFSMGQGLSATDAANLNSRTLTFLTAIGAN
jgi:hypothetical protein